jgi:AcrR family transcriptional regulator
MKEVLDAALRLLDRDGLEGLTMRRLADEAGLGVMTLYGYVRTKDELLGMLGAHAFRDVDIPDGEAPLWTEQLTSALHSLHSVFNRHPGIVDLLIAQVVTGPALNHVRNGLLGILIRAGFGARDAVEAYGSLVLYAFGFAIAERTRRRDGEHPILDPPYGPLDDFPYLRAVAAEYPARVSPDAFKLGLDHLVAGLAATLSGAARGSRARRSRPQHGTLR